MGWWTALSDHQMVVVSPLLDTNKGPGMWCFPDDLLDDTEYVNKVRNVILQGNNLDPQSGWDLLKSQLKTFTQTYTKFCCKQHKAELSSLQGLLHLINKRIY